VFERIGTESRRDGHGTKLLSTPYYASENVKD